MSRVFKQALEAYDATSTGGEGEGKDFIVMKGPLSELYTEALNKVYAKPDALTGVATESQANDAMMMQALANDVSNQGDQTDDTGGATTVYGVSATDLDNENFTDISKEFEGDDKFVLIIDGVQPGANSPDDSIPVERGELLTSAMESFVKANGGEVYHSLQEFANARATKKQQA